MLMFFLHFYSQGRDCVEGVMFILSAISILVNGQNIHGNKNKRKKIPTGKIAMWVMEASIFMGFSHMLFHFLLSWTKLFTHKCDTNNKCYCKILSSMS